MNDAAGEFSTVFDSMLLSNWQSKQAARARGALPSITPTRCSTTKSTDYSLPLLT